MDEFREHLVNLEGRIPTLIDLAKELGVSARRVNAEFTAKYGKSIYGFVTEHRLVQAHDILLSVPMPMKTLATRPAIRMSIISAPPSKDASVTRREA